MVVLTSMCMKRKFGKSTNYKKVQWMCQINYLNKRFVVNIVSSWPTISFMFICIFDHCSVIKEGFLSFTDMLSTENWYLTSMCMQVSIHRQIGVETIHYNFYKFRFNTDTKLWNKRLHEF